MKESKLKFTMRKSSKGIITINMKNSYGDYEYIVDASEMTRDDMYWAIRQTIVSQGWIFTEKMDRLINKELYVWV